MKKKQTQKIVILLLGGLFLLSLLIINQPKTLTIYQDTGDYGMVQINIREKSLIGDLFKPFSAVWQKTQAYTNEQVDIRDSVTRLNGVCQLEKWDLYIVKDGQRSILMEDMHEFSNDIGSCNLEVWVAFVTNELGTYGLESVYRWVGGSDHTSAGTNTLKVINNPDDVDCQWENWKLYVVLQGDTEQAGIVQIREYKDLDIGDNNDCSEHESEYRTICTNTGSSKYEIEGSPGVIQKEGIRNCVKTENNCTGSCDDPTPSPIKTIAIIFGLGLVGYGLISRGKNGKK